MLQCFLCSLVRCQRWLFYVAVFSVLTGEMSEMVVLCRSVFCAHWYLFYVAVFSVLTGICSMSQCFLCSLVRCQRWLFYVAVCIVLTGKMSEMVIRFIYIGVIADHHCKLFFSYYIFYNRRLPTLLEIDYVSKENFLLTIN